MKTSIKKKLSISIIVVLLIAAPLLCFSQQVFFDRTYDYDTTLDFGWNVFMQADSSYFITTGAQNIHTNHAELAWMIIKKDLSQAIQKHDIHSNSLSFYEGPPGGVKKLTNGGYVIPLSVDKYISSISQYHNSIGLVCLNAQLDTVFTSNYTDTTLFFENVLDCTIMPDRGYLLGAYRERNDDSTNRDKGLLIRTDSNGIKKWERAYWRDTSHSVWINSVCPLSSDRLLVGAMNITQDYLIGFGPVRYNSPWFLVLDTSGNILNDTLYGNYYCGGGTIDIDTRGGYFHFGQVDSFNISYPDNRDFPSYFAKLDTDFKIKWDIIFSYYPLMNYRAIWVSKQLRDSSYLMIGDASFDTVSHSMGWACKISKTGTIIWDHYYGDYPDSIEYYLRDACEKPDGSIVLTGAKVGQGQPQDVWLLGVDSNGCEQPNCWPLNIKQIIAQNNKLKIYPNPVTDQLIIESSEKNTIQIFNILGQLVYSSLIERNKEIINTSAFLNGTYILELTDNNGQREMRKIIK